jgi:hypothetical protein
MYNFKPWYTSTGVISPIVGMIGLILNLFGVPMTPTGMEHLATMASVLMMVFGFVGGLIGRLKATHQIGKPLSIEEFATFAVGEPPKVPGLDEVLTHVPQILSAARQIEQAVEAAKVQTAPSPAVGTMQLMAGTGPPPVESQDGTVTGDGAGVASAPIDPPPATPISPEGGPR